MCCYGNSVRVIKLKLILLFGYGDDRGIVGLWALLNYCVIVVGGDVLKSWKGGVGGKTKCWTGCETTK